VPAWGAVRIRLRAGAASGSPAATAGTSTAPVLSTGTSLDNGILRVEVDPRTGDISRLETTGRSRAQFVRPGTGLGAYRYVPGRDPAAAQPPGVPSVKVVERGPLLAAIEVTSTAPGTARLVRRISLAAGADAVDVEATLDKTLVREKESAHIAFPLDLPGGVIRADEGEALVTIGTDQLPGSCKDFIGVTSAIDVSNDRAGVSIASIDSPLFELGSLTDERGVNGGPRAWRTAVPGTDLYAYLLNNYWHTNYKADQSGEMTFRFRVRPHGAFDAAMLRRFGAEVEQPLLAAESVPGAPLPVLPFTLDGAAVASALKPADDGRGSIVRLYNPTPSAATPLLNGRSLRLQLSVVGADGQASQPLGGMVRVPAFGTIVVRVTPMAAQK
jgi:alpha-mannosidase